MTVEQERENREVLCRSFPDPMLARLVLTMCGSKTHIPFTAAELVDRYRVSAGLAQRMCDRAVEWNWCHQTTDKGTTYYIGRL